jgi:hypothetical protein
MIDLGPFSAFWQLPDISFGWGRRKSGHLLKQHFANNKQVLGA